MDIHNRDNIKQQVVDAVFARVQKVDGDGIYDIYDEPPTIEVLRRSENLKVRLKVETPHGTRFFVVSVSEVGGKTKCIPFIISRPKKHSRKQ